MSAKQRTPEKGIAVRYGKDGTPSYRGHVYSARDKKQIRGPWFAIRSKLPRSGKVLSQPHDTWLVLARGAWFLFTAVTKLCVNIHSPPGGAADQLQVVPVQPRNEQISALALVVKGRVFIAPRYS